MMETDPSEIINELIMATRKGGHIGIGAMLTCRHGCYSSFLTLVALLLNCALKPLPPLLCFIHPRIVSTVKCGGANTSRACCLGSMPSSSPDLMRMLCAVGVYAGYCNHFNIGAFMEKVSLQSPMLGNIVLLTCTCCTQSRVTLTSALQLMHHTYTHALYLASYCRACTWLPARRPASSSGTTCCA
jgi:hypothetical protein